MRYLIWDFDGTLGYREGGWTGALVEAWDEAFGEGTITRDHVRPYLQAGFPWHNPEIVRKAYPSPIEWWDSLFPIFERAYCEGCNADEITATALARRAQSLFLLPDRWRLYDDAIESLEALSDHGWRHLLLSNHVPELGSILSDLNIYFFFERIFNSAYTGVEKPNPQAFQNVLDCLPEGAAAIMIGDNVRADIHGAAQVGIPGVLVRGSHPEAEHCCADLRELVGWLVHR